MAGGPSAAIRAECPVATDQYDGLLSAADKTRLNNLGTAQIYWDDAKTWAQVYAEIVAAGETVNVVVAPYNGAYKVIPTGTYDLNNVIFEGSRAFIFVDAGVTLVAQAGVLTFVTDGPVFIFDGTVADSVVVAVFANDGYILNNSGNAIFTNIQDGSYFTASNAGAFVTSGGIAATIAGGATVYVSASNGATVNGFGGAAGFVDVSGAVDGSSRNNVQRNGAGLPVVTTDLASAPTIAVDPAQFTPITNEFIGAIGFKVSTKQLQVTYDSAWHSVGGSLDAYSDGTRPTANSVPVGTLIFNTDDNFPNVSDGTNWRNMLGVVT